MESTYSIRYSSDELKAFEDLINSKLSLAKEDQAHLKESIERMDSLRGGGGMEDGSDAQEKESLLNQFHRTQKFISDLERALFRIKNGTYGICKRSGKLIPKDRLMAVPHTEMTIESKNLQNR